MEDSHGSVTSSGHVHLDAEPAPGSPSALGPFGSVDVERISEGARRGPHGPAPACATENGRCPAVRRRRSIADAVTYRHD